MTTVSGSFTAAGVSSSLVTGAQGEHVTLSLSGTYAAVVLVQVALDRLGTAWKTLEKFTTANATVSRLFSGRGKIYRLVCSEFTSGEVVYSFSDGDAIVREFKDDDGNVILRLKQSGISVPGTISRNGGEAVLIAPYAGAVYQEFDLYVVNTGGTIQHRFQAPNASSSVVAVPAGLISTVNGALSTLTNTPTGADASTAFAAGAKISSASTHVLILDMPAQVVGEYSLSARVENVVAGAAASVYIDTLSFDVNGVTLVRPVLVLLTPSTGAALAWATLLNVAAEFIRIRISGYVKPAA